MTNVKAWLAFSILTVALGVGWLLTTMNVLDGVDWLGPILLATLGVLLVTLTRLDKATVVVSPFLLMVSACSVLRQTGRLTLNVEVPSLVIALGILMVLATLSSLPRPSWLQDPPDENNNQLNPP